MTFCSSNVCTRLSTGPGVRRTLGSAQIMRWAPEKFRGPGFIPSHGVVPSLPRSICDVLDIHTAAKSHALGFC